MLQKKQQTVTKFLPKLRVFLKSCPSLEIKICHYSSKNSWMETERPQKIMIVQNYVEQVHI